MATQLPRAERLARADDVIDNAGPRDGDRAAGRARSTGATARLPRRAAHAALDPARARSRQNGGRSRSRSPRHVIRYEHPLNERIRTLMRLEDLYRRAQFFAGAGRRARPSRGARSRCSRSPTSRRAPTSRPTSCRSSSGRSSCSRRCAAIRRSSRACSSALLADIDDVERAAARADRQGRRAPARQRMADGDQAAHGDSRRRLRVRPAGLSLLAAPATPAARRTTSHGWIEPFAADPRRARDHPAAPARQRPREPADRVPRRVPADADDDEGRAAPAPHASRATCPACPRSAPTSTRSTSASSASPGMDRGTVYDRDVEFELTFCNL